MTNNAVPDAAFPMFRVNKDDTFIDCYMDLVDWECELGCASGGNRVYPSIEDLKEHNRCWQGCGIVKVRVQFLEVVCEGTDE
jgi:hypothetical protein